jgi:hypothetical protein
MQHRNEPPLRKLVEYDLRTASTRSRLLLTQRSQIYLAWTAVCMGPFRRSSKRTSCIISAVIRTEDASFSSSCIVHDLSELGAKLVVEEQRSLPEEFILFLRATSPVGRRCRTMWRAGNKVGVRIMSVADFSRGRRNGADVWAAPLSRFHRVR